MKHELNYNAPSPLKILLVVEDEEQIAGLLAAGADDVKYLLTEGAISINASSVTMSRVDEIETEEGDYEYVHYEDKSV